MKATLEEKKKELKHDNAAGWMVLVLNDELPAKPIATTKTRRKQLVKDEMEALNIKEIIL